MPSPLKLERITNLLEVRLEGETTTIKDGVLRGTKGLGLERGSLWRTDLLPDGERLDVSLTIKRSEGVADLRELSLKLKEGLIGDIIVSLKRGAEETEEVAFTISLLVEEELAFGVPLAL